MQTAAATSPNQMDVQLQFGHVYSKRFDRWSGTYDLQRAVLATLKRIVPLWKSMHYWSNRFSLRLILEFMWQTLWTSKTVTLADKVTVEMQELITHLKDNGRSDFMDQANPANDADVLREIDQYQIRMNGIQRELEELKKCKQYLHYCMDKKVDYEEGANTLLRFFRAPYI